jgi:hypothetical protein
VNHKKYADILGYSLQIPTGLNLSIPVILETYMDSNNEESLKYQIRNLKLNAKSHPKGILLMRGQLLVSRIGGNVFGCYCHHDVFYVTESQLRLLQRLYSRIPEHCKRSYFPRDGTCEYAWSDPWNWPRSIGSSLSGDITYTILFGASLLSLLYAGCHATAWNAHFPTFIRVVFPVVI